MTVSTPIRLQGLRGIATTNIEFVVEGKDFPEIVTQIKDLKTHFETRYPNFVWNIQFPFHDLIFLDVDKPKKRKD